MGFEFTCWNGDIIRGAFVIDAHDREIIAWRAVVNAGISGSDVRDMMLEAVEKPLRRHSRAPSVIEWLRDNGSPYMAMRPAGLRPPARSGPLLHAGARARKATACARPS